MLLTLALALVLPFGAVWFVQHRSTWLATLAIYFYFGCELTVGVVMAVGDTVPQTIVWLIAIGVMVAYYIVVRVALYPLAVGWFTKPTTHDDRLSQDEVYPDFDQS